MLKGDPENDPKNGDIFCDCMYLDDFTFRILKKIIGFIEIVNVVSDFL